MSSDVRRLPEGTVTFLLTDVASSTAAWEREPAAMAEAISRHYELLDEVVAEHGGVRPVEQGEGDSVVAAFARPSDALAAAADAQLRLHAEAWPTTEPLRVRMALHTGEARLRDAGNYAGGAVIRTARLRTIGHGGQVLLSAATRDLVADDVGEGVELLDLGTHRLKDLARPERVWQLVHPAVPSSFPPLRSLDVVPNNLPVALSGFVGRFDAIDTVARLVFDNRLVTLMGTGGAGKTRLAQQLAAEIIDAFPDGVWWVDLAAVEHPDLVPSAVNRAAVLPEDRADRIGGLVRRLAASRALLVFDNCEHLVDVVADTVVAILSGCPDVVVLATSRTPLDVPGELTWRVPPMADDDAVRLFCDRAGRASSDFRLTGADAAVVAEICRGLDGVPLAIELAAARCRSMSLGEIRAGLGDSLELLSGRRRSVTDRHRTMDASIRFSHELLTDDERVAFRRLAAFSGPFGRDAAVALLADDRLSGRAVGRLLVQLVDHSLVQVQDGSTGSRFRLLETVRQFAAAQLEAAGEAAALARRHADHFADRALGLWPFFGPQMGRLLEQVDDEHADLTAMLGHLATHADPERHAEVASACLPAMSVRYPVEAAALGLQAAARVEPLTQAAGRLHVQLAMVDPNSPVHVPQAVAAAEATGDAHLLAMARFWQAWSAAGAEPTAATLDELAGARQHLEDMEEDHFSKAHWTLAGLHRAVGRHEEAWPHFERSRSGTVCKRCGVMVWGEGALLLLAAGDLDGARAALATSLDRAHEVRDIGFSGLARLVETELALYAGEAPPIEVVEAELAHARASGNPLALAYLQIARGTARAATGDLEGVDDDLAAASDLPAPTFPKATEARLRRVACRQAAGDRAGATALLEELGADAARWDAGPWLRCQLDHRAGALALDVPDGTTEADEHAHRSLADAWLGPFPSLVVDALELLVAVAAARGSWIEAARLHGGAAAQRDATGYRGAMPHDRDRTAAAVAAARDALGDAGFGTAVEAGRRLSIDGAVAYARRARGERKRPSHGWDGLTPTERQVADLAVQGRSNAEIAEQLLVGRETVKTHLSNVYAKVGVANRTQLVADAARRGITT